MDDPASAPSPSAPETTRSKLSADRVEALAAVLGLNIPPQYLAGVAENLERLLAQAKLMGEIDAPPGLDLAAVFRP